ncbi:MAG: radical SAM protein, partial [Lachnospiraceae bacterium]|nr:radical SAM protein [Lachnospiraceae bacterium]
MQNDVKVSDRYKAKYKSIDNESFISIPSFPNKNMILEVTNRCNHNCIFCYHYKMTTRQCDIDENLAIRVIHEAYELGMREIGFSKSGEPFLNSNLNQYINEAHNTGYEYIYLTTNGQLVTKERLKSAVESGLNSIKFSINAVNKRDYEFIHGVDAFEIVLQNLRDAYSYRKESGNKFKIFVSYVETKYTIKS